MKETGERTHKALPFQRSEIFNFLGILYYKEKKNLKTLVLNTLKIPFFSIQSSGRYIVSSLLSVWLRANASTLKADLSTSLGIPFPWESSTIN